MTPRNLIITALIGLGVASCGENQPASTNTQSTLDNGPTRVNPVNPVEPVGPQGGTPVQQAPQQQRSDSQVKPTVAAQQASTVPQKPAIPKSVMPPDGALWTISCDLVEGPGHVSQAEGAKQRLIEVTRMPDWHVVHTEQNSEILYGYYGDFKGNAPEHARMDSDRQHILALTDARGDKLLRDAILTPVVMPDPVAPPNWNLLSTPKDAFWTIEVATFVDIPNRKQAAVDAVRAFREKTGRNDIYFYHGPSVSSVCVGAWKREAIAEQGTGLDTNTGKMRGDAFTQDPNAPLLVISGVAPANMPSRVLEPGTGKPMVVQGMRLEVLDQDMKAAMVTFRDHSVNGMMHVHTENGKDVADPSMLTQIPHDASSSPVTDDNWRIAGGVRPPTDAPAQRPVATGGDDILRSFGTQK